VTGRGLVQSRRFIEGFVVALVIAGVVTLGLISEPWHMFEHLALALVIAPWILLRLSSSRRRRIARLVPPLLSLGLLAIVVPLLHLSVLAESLQPSVLPRTLEMMVLTAVSLLFWAPVTPSQSHGRALSHGAACLYVAALGPVYFVAGLVMAHGSPASMRSSSMMGGAHDMNLGAWVMAVGGCSSVAIWSGYLIHSWLRHERGLRESLDLSRSTLANSD
jgi:cytochrome c oxidase assembly factor CtaG